MYSNPKTHKNLASFTPVGYTTIGDPYQPKQKNADSRFKGTQFRGGRRKKDHFGDFISVNQVKTKDGSYASDPYDKKKKSESFKPNDKGTAGFGSKDSRAILAATRESECYREKLKQELRAIPVDPADVQEDLNGDGVVDELDSMIAMTLYDRVTAANDEDLKPYKKGQKTLNKGSMQTSASQYGAYVGDANKQGKVHARVAVCKQFFNTGKIGLGNQDSGYLNM